MLGKERQSALVKGIPHQTMRWLQLQTQSSGGKADKCDYTKMTNLCEVTVGNSHRSFLCDIGELILLLTKEVLQTREQTLTA